MKRKLYKKIDEIVYTTTLSNGMKVYLLYKKGFNEKTAYVVSKFGHFDSNRYISLNSKKVKIPWGAAHFLEHRMFSIDNIDATSLFASYGANCNAYTTYEKTTYYFNTQNNFYECLDILLKMVNSFTSTSLQIENEKDIIIQEANMYKENPNHILNSTLYKQAYVNHPIKMDIIGEKQTIENTSKEMLEAIFNTFYDPSNLSLVVCGDIDHNELESYLNNNLLSKKNYKKIKPLKIKEPLNVLKEKGEVYLSTINMPRVGFLYKLNPIKDKVKKDKMYFCYNLILDYLFASSGKLSEKWLNDSTLTTLLDYSIMSNIDLDCIIFYNINTNIENLISNIKGVFNEQNKLNITQSEFDDLKKSHFGATIRAYESVSGLASYFVADLYTSANDFFNEIDEVKELTLNDMNEAFKNICNASTSLVILRGE